MENSPEQLVVRPHQPGRRRLEIVGCLFMVVLAWLLGSHYFSQEMVEKRRQDTGLQSLQKKSAQLEQRLANAEVATQVDRVALEHVRQLVTSLQLQLATNEEELNLYRNLLPGTDRPKGLAIGDLILRQQAGQPGVFYRLVLQQKETKLSLVKVELAVAVEGTVDGEVVQLGLDKLDSAVEAMPLKTEFKYFQVVEGVLNLPEGFEPGLIRASLWRAGRQNSKVEREFDWRLEQ